MSVLRQGNWLGQQRIDIPHIRAVESSIAADLDLLSGIILAGKAPLVVSGFELITAGISQAESLQLSVADSTLMHFYASEAGSIFHVPVDRAAETLGTTNARVIGSFTPSQVNYIGLDVIRSADTSTTDVVQFLNPTTGIEDPRTVPLARTLDYRIVISTVDFDSRPGIAPLAKVTTNGTNGIVSVEDARSFAFRLGSGGTVPRPLNAYSWPAGRTEGAVGTFRGGDKGITSFKGWADAIMTRLWEVGGGEHWFSPTSLQNVKFVQTGAVFASTGEHFEWVANHLHWQGLKLIFANSTAAYNTIADQIVDSAGLTDLADGECIYVDWDCSSNAALTAVKCTLASLGSPTVPGSRYVIAWRSGTDIFIRDQGWMVGSSFKLATIASPGTVKLGAEEFSPPIVPVLDASNLVVGAGLTRGGASFIGGPGDITIGGGANDQSIVLSAATAGENVQVSGSIEFAGPTTAAVLESANAVAMAGKTDLCFKAKGYNGVSLTTQTGLWIESSGVIGFRNADDTGAVGTPATPPATAADPIRAKFYLTSNGLASPNKRDRLCVMWHTGTVTVIAEGPAY